MNKEVWANALLSDGEILFWWTGSECTSIHDFYKDFMHAGIDEHEYFKSHNMKLAKIGFIDNADMDWNELIFTSLAKEFYRMFRISPDSKGSKPY